MLPYNDTEAVRDAFMQAEGQVAAIMSNPFLPIAVSFFP